MANMILDETVLDLESLRQAAGRHLPPTAAKEFLRLAKPSMALIKLDECDPDAPVSRFGGKALVSADFEWPHWRGAPLSLIAQLRLDNLPAQAELTLPATGLLSFFYAAGAQPQGKHPDDRGAAMVVYSELDSIFAVETPHGATQYPAQEIALQPSPSIPSISEDVMAAMRESYGQELQQLYNELAVNYRELHQVGGWPQLVRESGIGLVCEFASNGFDIRRVRWDDPRAENLSAGETDWQLLLQVDVRNDAEDNPLWSWGDQGRLYFLAREQEIRKRRFDLAWVIRQSR